MVRPLHLPVTVPVRGTAYRQAAVVRCHEGMRALVRHVPDHPEDANACEILTLDGQLLGYVPGAISERAALHPAYDAKIVEVLHGETVGLRVKLLAVLNSPAAATPGLPPDPSDPDDVDDLPSPERGTRPPARQGARQDAPTVSTKTGRPVGTLLRRSGRQVIVATDAGPVPYPAALVTIGDTQPAAAPTG